MDKYDQILDLIEHPDNYTVQQMEVLLADKEAREFYNLLCKTGSTMHQPDLVDVEAEWKAFSRKNFRKKFPLLRGSRAASIAALVFASAAALAIGTGVIIKVTSRQDPILEEVKIAEATNEVLSTPIDTIIVEKQKEFGDAPVLFDNETLATALKVIAAHYEKELSYLDPNAGYLYLYYRWDPHLPLEEVIEQLNTFGQINLRLDDKTIIVDKP